MSFLVAQGLGKDSGSSGFLIAPCDGTGTPVSSEASIASLVKRRASGRLVPRASVPEGARAAGLAIARSRTLDAFQDFLPCEGTRSAGVQGPVPVQSGSGLLDAVAGAPVLRFER
jgi:hypothetical protein